MNKIPVISPLFRLLICILIIFFSIALFIKMNEMKKPPEIKPPDKKVPVVDVVEVEPTSYLHIIRGLGEVSSKKEVVLSAEVQGEIMEKSQKAEAGNNVRQGELLFLIDPQEYKINLDTALAREKTLNRDLQIATSELKRVKDLYENKKIGSLSELEQTESKVNNIKNQLAQTRQQAEVARIKLNKCSVKAPFAGRIKEVKTEKGELVNPGQKLVTIIDDTNLEITVPVNSKEVTRWLRLEEKETTETQGWYNSVYPAKSYIIWTENPGVNGTGVVKRVVNYDSNSRMFRITVDLTDNSAKPIPLCEGMFCRVEIEGKELQNVFIIPRNSVQDNRVMVVEEGRLKIRPVEIAEQDNKQVVVKQGLRRGDKVITTPIKNPVENSPVKVITDKQ